MKEKSSLPTPAPAPVPPPLTVCVKGAKARESSRCAEWRFDVWVYKMAVWCLWSSPVAAHSGTTTSRAIVAVVVVREFGGPRR